MPALLMPATGSHAADNHHNDTIADISAVPSTGTAPPAALAPQPALHVRDFVIEGGDGVPAGEVQRVLDPYRGRSLTMADAEAAADRVTALYRSRGFLVARAYLPPQDAGNGELLVRVRMGKFGDVALKNNSLVGDAPLRRALAGMAGGAAVSSERLERAMLVIGDMPGAQVPKLSISPGKAAGTSDFDVAVEAGRRHDGYVTVDNRDSVYTGKHRASLGAGINSPFGIGDRIDVAVIAARDASLVNGRVAYAFPVGADGWRASLAAARTSYDLGGPFAGLGAAGTARAVEAGLRYPVLRTQQRNLYAGLSVAARRLRDDMALTGASTPRRQHTATVDVRYEVYPAAGGVLAIGGGLTAGRLAFLDPSQEAANRAGADTAGHYARANASAMAVVPAGRWQWLFNVEAQKALRDKNLDASEQIGISGRSGVRAYRDAYSGDNGVLAGAEARYLLPGAGVASHHAALFAEAGRVRLQNGAYSATDRVTLAGAGIGYRLAWRGAWVDVQAARGIGPRPPGGRHGSRLLFEAGMTF